MWKQVIAKFKDSILGQGAPRLEDFPDTLRSVSIFVTENCNSRCGSCDCWKSKHPWDEHLTVSQWASVLGDLARVGVVRTRISGGEPLLYRGIFELMDEAAALGITPSLQTNGLLLRRYAAEINASPLASLHVSLDGVGEVNDNLRGVPGHFEKVLDGLSLIEKPCFVTTTPYRDAVPWTGELIALCRERNLGIEFNLPSTDLFYLKEATVDFPEPGQVDGFIDTLRSNGDLTRTGEDTLAFMERYLKERRIGFTSCVLGLKKIYIGYSGDVFAACFPLGPLGNVRERPVLEIVKDPAYKRRLEKMIALQCPGCVCGFNGNPKQGRDDG